jgi:hypothetical protein
MLLLHLYTKGKGNTSIGIVKRILSKDYEDAGYPPPTNVKKQKITQKMGDSEEKNLFAIDKKCREELYNDIQMSSNTCQRRIPLTRHIPFHRTTTVRQLPNLALIPI